MSTLWRKNTEIDYKQILDDAWALHLEPRQPDAPTVISTFAGGGGSSLGYSMAGFNELLAVEWDDNAVETLRLNFPDLRIYHGDIAKLSVEQCLEMAGIQPGELDVFDGSPPCQGFSTAGKRILNDPRNQLFREYVRLLQGIKPKVFVMENVSGMVKGKMKLVFAEIMKELKASGYKVSARLMNAMYFNVPQSRQRMIFIGVRDDLGVEPGHPGAMLPTIPLKRMDSSVGGNEWLSKKRCISILEHGPKQKAKGNSFHPIFLDENKPFPTIPKTRSGNGSLYFRTGNKFRYPTIDELKYGGSYPNCFEFTGGASSAMNRIGNSVPPLFMKAIAEHIRAEILGKIKPELIDTI